jgi:hypothetical protein
MAAAAPGADAFPEELECGCHLFFRRLRLSRLGRAWRRASVLLGHANDQLLSLFLDQVIAATTGLRARCKTKRECGSMVLHKFYWSETPLAIEFTGHELAVPGQAESVNVPELNCMIHFLHDPNLSDRSGRRTSSKCSRSPSVRVAALDNSE